MIANMSLLGSDLQTMAGVSSLQANDVHDILQRISLMIEDGIDINSPMCDDDDAQNKVDRRPLVVACRQSDVDIELVDRLLKHGAHCDAESLVAAAISGRYDLVDLLVTNCTDTNTAIRRLVEERTADAVPYLVERGATVNEFNDEDGRMPLHVAVENADFDTVQTLVLCGADVNAADNTGMSNCPLHLLGSSDIVK